LRPKYKSVIQFVVFLSIGLGLMLFAIKNLDLNYDKVLNGFKSANYFWLISSLIVSLLSHFIRAIRWNLLLEPLQLKAKNINAFNAVMIGYLFNFAIPRMGEVSRCGILLKTDNIPMDKSLGTVVVERVFDMVILLGIAFFVFILQFDMLYDFFSINFFIPIGNKLSAISLTGSLFIIVGFGLFFYLLFKFKNSILKSKIAVKILSVLTGFAQGFKAVFKLKQPGLFLTETVLIWVLYFFNTFCLLNSFDATADLSLLAKFTILVMGTFGFAAPVSGGIGAYHIFVAKGLALYGVSSVAGGVFGFVSHGIQMITIMFIGSISLIYTIALERKNLSK
jgi:uncharacterized protein (TIRG00374 family)